MSSVIEAFQHVSLRNTLWDGTPQLEVLASGEPAHSLSEMIKLIHIPTNKARTFWELLTLATS